MRKTRSGTIVAGTFLAYALATHAASPDDALRDAWLHAPKSQGAKWTRVKLLEQLLTGVELVGMPRVKILDLLGQPGRADDSYPDRARMDFYRLSAANDQSLRVDYDAQDKVTRSGVELSPCACDFCFADAPELAAAALAKSGLFRAAPPGNLTMSAFARLVGRPGKIHHTQDRMGGQMWLNYSQTWRVAGGNQFLATWGHTPLRDAPTFDVTDKPVYDWTLVSFARDCLAK